MQNVVELMHNQGLADFIDRHPEQAATEVLNWESDSSDANELEEGQLEDSEEVLGQDYGRQANAQCSRAYLRSPSTIPGSPDPDEDGRAIFFEIEINLIIHLFSSANGQRGQCEADQHRYRGQRARDPLLSSK